MNSIDLYILKEKVLSVYPELEEEKDRCMIAKSLICTNGSLEKVEFITESSKSEIIDMYQKLCEIDEVSKIFKINDFKETNTQSQNKPVSTKQRKFKRSEMVNYLKQKINETTPDVEFLSLKYNVLTCQQGDRIFTIYISTSRDYEFLKPEDEVNPKRISGWHKGDSNIFSGYDYYAMLVKKDEKSEYPSDEVITGIFMSNEELQDWISRKERNQSGMINCYVHYTKDEKDQVHVSDTRERPHINLTHLYNNNFNLK